MAEGNVANQSDAVEKRRREAAWRTHVARWRGSALSQAAYCRRHGLKPADFSWWKNELIRRGATAADDARKRAEDTSPRFIEVRSNSPALASAPVDTAANVAGVARASFEIVLRNGRIVRTGADFDAAVLGRLLAAVDPPC